jgi:hypothetical protein
VVELVVSTARVSIGLDRRLGQPLETRPQALGEAGHEPGAGLVAELLEGGLGLVQLGADLPVKITEVREDLGLNRRFPPGIPRPSPPLPSFLPDLGRFQNNWSCCGALAMSARVMACARSRLSATIRRRSGLSPSIPIAVLQCMQARPRRHMTHDRFLPQWP